MNKFDWCGYEWTSLTYKKIPFDPKKQHEWFCDDSVHVGCLGNMTLRVLTYPKEITDSDGNSHKPLFGVGAVKSIDAFGYGTFSVEILFPNGKFLMPEFNIVCADDDKDAGINVANGYCDECRSYFRFTSKAFPYIVPGWRVSSSVHNGKNISRCVCNIPVTKVWNDPSSDFVKYEVEWTDSHIIFKADGKTTCSCSKDTAMLMKGKKAHVVLSLSTENEDFEFDTPMIIRNFKYTPING